MEAPTVTEEPDTSVTSVVSEGPEDISTPIVPNRNVNVNIGIAKTTNIATGRNSRNAINVGSQRGVQDAGVLSRAESNLPKESPKDMSDPEVNCQNVTLNINVVEESNISTADDSYNIINVDSQKEVKEAGSPLSRAESNLTKEGVNKNKAGLMKAETDQTEAMFVHRILVQQAMSVGIIRSPSICGTGFRVGSCFIMTAKHVIDKIMVAAVPLGQQIKQRHPLSNRDVFIDFSYEMDERTSSESLSFHFEPTIIYSNDELDTVILQLKHDNTKMYPPPLTKFTLPPKNESHGYFIGHSKGKIKKTDKYKCVTLNPHEIAAAREWSVKRVNVDGFVGIDDSRRVLLHCSFENGASGSPGFWIDSSSGKAYVLMMLLRGYPDWYYDENYKDKTIGMLPKDLIEQGVYMTAIYDDLNKRNTVLCQEIFNFQCDDVEMV